MLDVVVVTIVVDVHVVVVAEDEVASTVVVTDGLVVAGRDVDRRTVPLGDVFAGNDGASSSACSEPVQAVAPRTPSPSTRPRAQRPSSVIGHRPAQTVPASAR